jgi:cytochrome d ubiquinol oxidase subunit II
LFIGVMAYAVFGGADFGSGFFDLTAGGASSGAELRTLVDHSIGPVWEANHAWLIYVLVTWWTAFPQSFASAMSTLIVPMLLALLGIALGAPPSPSASTSGPWPRPVSTGWSSPARR